MKHQITSVEEADKLLLEIKEKIQKNGILFLKSKVKNSQTLGQLGMMVHQVKDIIMG